MNGTLTMKTKCVKPPIRENKHTFPCPCLYKALPSRKAVQKGVSNQGKKIVKPMKIPTQGGSYSDFDC